MKTFASALLLLLGLAGCEGKTSSPPMSPDPGVAVPSAAPSATPTPTGAAVPRAFPPLDVTCATDADCMMTDLELVDAPPRTYACCPGCTNRAGSKTWKGQFDTACKASPPPMCPPIGCAMPNQTPVCVAKKCALK